MTEVREDWKQRALDDFREWLENAAGEIEALAEVPESEDPDSNVLDSELREFDLHSLLSEFVALRREIQMQNREQSKAIREIDKVSTIYDLSVSQAQRRELEFAALEKQTARAAEDRCMKSFLDVRDALARGWKAVAGARGGRQRFWRPGPSPQITAVSEGYEMAIKRFDRILSGFGVQMLEAVGQPFDPRTMHAMETRQVEGIEDGRVIEEFRHGFLRNGEPLRLADVAVNRVSNQE